MADDEAALIEQALADVIPIDRAMVLPELAEAVARHISNREARDEQ